MRAIVCVALALLLAVSASRPARAVEPDAPQALITRAEAIRIAVQANLSEKFTTTTNSKKAEQGALVEYYAVADQPTLWVDEHGLTERGKAVIAEIEQADDYGLRASDYPLPNLAEFTGSGPSATAMARRCRAQDQLCRARLRARCARRQDQPLAALSQSRPRPRSAQPVRGDRVRSPFARIPPPICGASSRISRNSRRSGRS